MPQAGRLVFRPQAPRAAGSPTCSTPGLLTARQPGASSGPPRPRTPSSLNSAGLPWAAPGLGCHVRSLAPAYPTGIAYTHLDGRASTIKMPVRECSLSPPALPPNVGFGPRGITGGGEGVQSGEFCCGRDSRGHRAQGGLPLLPAG